jgi:hypothetical protein
VVPAGRFAMRAAVFAIARVRSRFMLLPILESMVHVKDKLHGRFDTGALLVLGSTSAGGAPNIEDECDVDVP